MDKELLYKEFNLNEFIEFITNKEVLNISNNDILIVKEEINKKTSDSIGFEYEQVEDSIVIKKYNRYKIRKNYMSVISKIIYLRSYSDEYYGILESRKIDGVSKTKYYIFDTIKDFYKIL